MAERERYTPGTFSWAELASADQEAAKRFYGELFGWEMTDNPVGEGAVYTMASLAGRYVAAISPQPRRLREAGVSPLWNAYITVTSADQALHAAREAGGTVHAPAFDVLDAGRMGVVQDPQGAYFMVWEPRGHIGAGRVNEAGALAWNELATPDIEASAAFYGRVFGWTTQAFEGMGTPYRIVKNADGHTNGGLRRAASTEPCYWLTYFGTDDMEASLEAVHRLGGRKLIDPFDMGPGRIAVVQDPEEAVFALYGGHFDP